MKRTVIRDQHLQLCVSQVEKDRAMALARRRGQTLSELLRDLLRREDHQATA